ncbi:hypothetical protein WMY93_011726 [Mugilogobius chulae]|uniref:Uncharacterized protein n=1 Tax=Mugilogobius chulae TaxID=88201 RepID=A0AAW0P3G9_9GOBI
MEKTITPGQEMRKNVTPRQEMEKAVTPRQEMSQTLAPGSVDKLDRVQRVIKPAPDAVPQEDDNQQQHDRSEKKSSKHRWKTRVAPTPKPEPVEEKDPCTSPKKKNFFQRILTWFRRHTCCRVGVWE